MLVTLLAEHWPLSTTYKLDWRSWLWEIVNWKWLTTDSVDFSFLCSSLQTPDPTHASECREEARTRMADRGDVGISDTRTQQHWLCLLTAAIYLQYKVHARFAPLRWRQGAGSRDTLTRSLQGLSHGGIHSQALDQVNVKLVPKQNRNKQINKQPKALLSVVVFANSSVVLLARVCFRVVLNTN